MATTRSTAKGRTLAAARQRKIRQQAREHYRAHLTTRDGDQYNPLLDEPKTEEGNYRGWTHGQFEGYSVAGCHCTLCRKANSDKADASVASALAKLKAARHPQLRALLATHRPDLDEEGIAAAVEAVMRTTIEERLRGNKARITFRPELVELALQAAAGDTRNPPWDHTKLQIVAGEFCGTVPGARS